MIEKHYVYPVITTEQRLDLRIIAPMPSKFLVENEERRKT
jgi:hypothetical protein